jgi:hypothetical protein
MVIEARKHNVRFVWAYIVGGILVAISVTFPLFLIARELRMRTSDESSPSDRHRPARPGCRCRNWPDYLATTTYPLDNQFS